MSDFDHAKGYYEENACDLGEFVTLTSQTLNSDQLSFVERIEKNIPIYDAHHLKSAFDNVVSRRAVMAEWAHILHSSSGTFVIKNAQPDLGAIDAATGIFHDIISEEKAAHGSGADHFAAAGSNDRIWNSLQKLCEAAPETFMRYFASPAIDAACEAWLGPNYQMTAQVNLVHPGGQAQQAHRDYHLGFQTAEISATYPAHVHDLSPLMTLQGGIAHCDISIESGPTKLLPFSQMYRPGYAAWRRDDFRSHFEENYVQLPLQKGDAVFFNPALFHAAGENRTKDVHRMVNLLQISSPFGRAMEVIDRKQMSELLFPHLAKAWTEKTLDEGQLDAVIAASAEGYSFPTNLDNDPPIGGLAPKTMAGMLKDAVLKQLEFKDLQGELDALGERQQP